MGTARPDERVDATGRRERVQHDARPHRDERVGRDGDAVAPKRLWPRLERRTVTARIDVRGRSGRLDGRPPHRSGAREACLPGAGDV